MNRLSTSLLRRIVSERSIAAGHSYHRVINRTPIDPERDQRLADLLESDHSAHDRNDGSAGRIFHWRDVLFASTFNEIVRIEQTNFDVTQYSLFREKNLIKSFDKGFHSFLPLLVRAYERLVRLVDRELQSIGCQKIIMPAIVGKSLWVRSERWDQVGDEIFKLKDRHKDDYCLAPTQEETVTAILASCRQLSHRQLPVYLYQITPKYRDELRTKFGLLRAREFIMKDLYTFDTNEEAAMETYEKVCSIYRKLFTLLELPVIQTFGSVGSIGGKYSHEFLLPTPLGEDEVYTCGECSESFNSELIEEYMLEQGGDGGTTSGVLHCPKCKVQTGLGAKRKALELGHSFLLGDRYSAKLDAIYYGDNNKQLPLQMGCYGLGLSRILAGSVEYLSNTYVEQEEAEALDNEPETKLNSKLVMLRWPRLLTPFKVCLILPKKGSKEDQGHGTELSMHLAKVIRERFGEDVLLDDRSNLTIGKRLLTAKAIGIPFIIVAGRNIIDNMPLFEVYRLYQENCHEGNMELRSQLEVLDILEANLKSYSYFGN